MVNQRLVNEVRQKAEEFRGVLGDLIASLSMPMFRSRRSGCGLIRQSARPKSGPARNCGRAAGSMRPGTPKGIRLGRDRGMCIRVAI